MNDASPEVAADSAAVNPPKVWGFDLWQHLHREHGLTLTQDELSEIIRLSLVVMLDENPPVYATLSAHQGADEVFPGLA